MDENWQRGDYIISTDRERLDINIIHRYLSEESYWARGRTRAVVEDAIRNSLCFGIYHEQKQIGFCRVVTDRATFAWLCDVFVLPEWRGRGLSVWMLQIVSDYPSLQGLRRWILATRDAHSLYRRFGFVALDSPERFMQKFTEA